MTAAMTILNDDPDYMQRVVCGEQTLYRFKYRTDCQWDWFTGYLPQTVHFCPNCKDSERRYEMYFKSRSDTSRPKWLTRTASNTRDGEAMTARERAERLHKVLTLSGRLSNVSSFRVDPIHGLIESAILAAEREMVEKCICALEKYGHPNEFSTADRVRALRKLLNQSPEVRNKVESRPTIICLCGSGRFKDVFDEVEFAETLQGKIVLTIGCNTKDIACDADLSRHKPLLDELHLRKIDLADEVLILNVGDYIGESTSRELEYARKCGKCIRFLEDHIGDFNKMEE